MMKGTDFDYSNGIYRWSFVYFQCGVSVLCVLQK